LKTSLLAVAPGSEYSDVLFRERERERERDRERESHQNMQESL